MENNEYQLAVRYAPYFYFDKKEPFPIQIIGYEVHRKTGRSRSFDRLLSINPETALFVIEYAVYFDYDIQHLYDLEHVWVWVGHDGNIADVECSSHGRVVNCWRYLRQTKDTTHPVVYGQPGKHAFFPDGKLFLLFSDYRDACGKLAGIDGVLVSPYLQGRIMKDRYVDYLVCEHIRENYSFEPSMDFTPCETPAEVFCPIGELFPKIEERLRLIITEIQKDSES